MYQSSLTNLLVFNGTRILWAETSYKIDVKDGVAIEYCAEGKTIWENGDIEPEK